MSLEVIYVTRHGFRPAFNVDPATGTYSLAIRSPTGLPTDPPLTAYGADQANDLARHLLKVDPPIDQVYSSPYYRCLQTISPFVARLKEGATAAAGDGRRPQPPSIAPSPDPGPGGSGGEGGREAGGGIRVEAGISEWYGLAPWEHPTSAPLSELTALFPNSAIDASYTSRVVPPRHGESIAQLHERAAAAIAALVEQSDREGARAIVLNTHAAVVIALGRVLTGRMPASVEEEDFKAFTCGLSVYRRRRPRSPPEATAVPEGSRVPGGVSSGSIQNTTNHTTWADGSGVGGGWDCEADSDCSFLQGGEERGWRFSGDEDFVSLGSRTLEDARAGLGVVVEKGGGGSSSSSNRQPQSGDDETGNNGKSKL
ncbi:uncharacterized protein PG986_013544 [Apiospora aurea]|uniref:Phosphoglycerate mutase family protein n=1 Tax=Apiospora aurea TaxID=335848 RepID=A0ABR1PVU7_9PEZI